MTKKVMFKHNMTEEVIILKDAFSYKNIQIFIKGFIFKDMFQHNKSLIDT